MINRDNNTKKGITMKNWIVSLLFFALLPGSILVHAQTLDANDFTDSGGGDGTGLFIDLTATNAISVVSLDFYSNAVTGAPVTVAIYARPGTYMGFEGNAAGWSQIASISRNNNNNADPDTFVLPSSLDIAAGQTMGILIVGVVGGVRWADVSGSETFNDANLTPFTEIGSDGGAFSGSLDTFRNFAGSVTYSVSPVVPPPPPPPGPVTPVPTMSQWALITLAMLIAGIVFVRRKQLA